MNAKHLRELLEQGHRVQISRNQGIVIAYAYESGGFLLSDRSTTGLQLCDWFNEELIENCFTDDYKIVTPAPKLLEVGDEVEILENYGKHRNPIDSVLIEKAYDSRYVLTLIDTRGDIKIRMDVPHRAVAKLPPKEDETIKIIDGKKYKLLDTEE